jgi:hypothetical protein
MQTPELIEKLEQRGLKVTVKQAHQAIAELGKDPNGDHDETVLELVAEIINQARAASGGTKKNGKGAAIAKNSASQEQKKSALVANKNKAAIAAAKVRVAEGKQLAQQGAMAMAEAYLTESANCYEQFTESVIESQARLMGIADEAFVSFDVDAALKESGEDFLLEGSGDRLALPGAFSL